MNCRWRSSSGRLGSSRVNTQKTIKRQRKSALLLIFDALDHLKGALHTPILSTNVYCKSSMQAKSKQAKISQKICKQFTDLLK